jgi:hypothetical protein
MKHVIWFGMLGAGVCVLTALSCSGGGGGGTGAPSATTMSSVSSGVITGFGSVKLNGKEYETPQTSFVLDGQPGSQNDLKVGMVVMVTGSLSSTGARTATTITQDDVVDGAIQSIPATNDRLVVFGQTVLIDDGTRFDTTILPPNLSGLAPGDLVAVNGFVKGNGVIMATLIEKKTPPPTCQVQGIVDNHNSGAQTFTIGGLLVHYSSAVIDDMPSPAGTAWNDVLVEVNGSPCDRLTTTTNATEIEPARMNVTNADEIQVEGAITQFSSSASFSVNGVPVVTNATTIFEGALASDVALGVEVEVEGSLVNGILIAGEVSFKDSVELEGDVNTVTSGGATPNVTIAGLPGITVFVKAQTEFTGGLANLGQLVVGDHVRVQGQPTGATTVMAARVERRAADTRVSVDGAVQAVATPAVTVLGVPINTAGISDTNFTDSDDAVIGRAAFFSAVKGGTFVEAKGNLIGGSVVWNAIGID